MSGIGYEDELLLRPKMGRLIGEHGEEERIARSILSLFKTRPRPTDKFGRTHFHFRMSSVARGKPTYSTGQAVRFQKYIEREPALEVDDEGPISFGNMGEDGEERRLFWKAVEESERRIDSKIQERIELEIPYELREKPAQVRRMLKEFTEVFQDRGLPFHVVVHVPPVEEKTGLVYQDEPLEDSRNLHAHIVWSERPFRRKGRGVWAFSRKKNRNVHHKMFPAVLRNHYCDVANKFLSQHPDISLRLTPHSFEDSGINRKPLWHVSRATMHALSRGQWTDELISLAKIHAENLLRELEVKESEIVITLQENQAVLSPKKPLPVFVVEKTPKTYTRMIFLGEPKPGDRPLAKTVSRTVPKVIKRLAEERGFDEWRVEDYSDKEISEDRQFQRRYQAREAFLQSQQPEEPPPRPREYVDPRSIKLTESVFIDTVKSVWYEVYGFDPEEPVLKQAAQDRLYGDTPAEFIVRTTTKRGVVPVYADYKERQVENIVSEAVERHLDFVEAMKRPKQDDPLPSREVVSTPEQAPPKRRKGYCVVDDPVDPAHIPGLFRHLNDEDLSQLAKETEKAVTSPLENSTVKPAHLVDGFKRGLGLIQFEQKRRARQRVKLYGQTTPGRGESWER